MQGSKKARTKKKDFEPIWHPTQHDESDELEEAKNATEEYEKLLNKKQALIKEIEEAKKTK
tara:strand:+ start:92 stop:274 length:183 start_codon:yes stop_codon:yes gene_type:complete